MTKGTLNRDEAIKLVGIEAIENVENENCDFSIRVQTDGDTRVEFSASISCIDFEGNLVTLVAYYYQEEADLEGIEDLGDLNWIIEGYEIY